MKHGQSVAIVGVGGIFTAEDAWSRIRAGASLVQLYSAMVYEGPGIARRITRGLEKLKSWLGKGKWDVIHFNWGLHDLKYMDAMTLQHALKSRTLMTP